MPREVRAKDVGRDRSTDRDRRTDPRTEAVADALREPGLPVDADVAAALPQHMRYDLAGVRIHADASADRAALAIDAAAWTVGHHVGFRAGRFRPSTAVGRALLAHELAHVHQSPPGPGPGAIDGAAFVLADRAGWQEGAARRALSAGAVPGPPVPARPDTWLVHRQETGTAVLEPDEILAPDEGFRWTGPPSRPLLVVRPSWLVEQGVPRGTPVVRGSAHPRVLEPILRGLLATLPWADPERALAGLDDLGLQLTPASWEGAEAHVPVGSSVFAIIGLPPAAPVLVSYQADGSLQIMVDMVQLAPGGDGDDAVTADRPASDAVVERVVQALEQAVEGQIAPHLRPIVVEVIGRHLSAGSGVWTDRLSPQSLTDLFGETAYRAYAERQGEGGEHGTVMPLPGVGTVMLPPGVTVGQLEVLTEVLSELGVQPATPAEAPAVITAADVAALLELAESADRAEIVAEIRRSRAGATAETAESAATVRDVVESARESLDWRRSAASIGHDFEEGADEQPIVPRPVHGEILNPDRLVPGLEAHFTFRTTDAVDAFRVPHVSIHWFARTAPSEDGTPGRVVEDDVTNYIEVRPHGLLNERIFEVTFDEPGIYEVHAFVNHNFYLPAHVQSSVEVVTEATVLEEFHEQAAPGWGAEDRPDEPYEFTEIATDEASAVTLVVGVPLAATSSTLLPLLDAVAGLAPSSGYAVGTRSEGVLTTAARGESLVAFSRRRSQLEAELTRLAEVEAGYDTGGGVDRESVLEAVRERRTRIQEAIAELDRLDADEATVAVPTRGFYASRTHGIPSAPLTLVTYFTVSGTGAGRRYDGHILDQSQLLEARHYHLRRSAPTYAAVMEGLFVDLSQVYPNGRVSLAFQDWDEATAAWKNRFVRFERVTDTVEQDVTDVAFSAPVSLGINILATLLTIFPPTAVIGIGLGLAYNAASVAHNISDDLRRGTLSADRTSVELLMLGLDLVPVVGRAGRFVRLGTRTYRVVDVAQLAGMSYLLTEDAELQIRTLREGGLTELAALDAEIERIGAVNASDPSLSDLRRRRAAVLEEVRTAASRVYGEAITTQALTLGATAVIGRVGEAVLERPAVTSTAGHGRGRPETETRPRTAEPADRPVPAEPAGRPVPAEPADRPSRVEADRGAPRDTTPSAPERTPAQWDELQTALGDLSDRVPIEAGDHLDGNTVRVHYDPDGDLRVVVGPLAGPGDIRRHLATIRMLRRFEGPLGRLLRLLGRVRSLLTGYPPYGSAGFEARAEITKLTSIIDELTERRAAVQERADRLTSRRTDADTEVAAIDREIAALEEQVTRYEGEVDSLGPGRGFVAQEDTTGAGTPRRGPGDDEPRAPPVDAPPGPAPAPVDAPPHPAAAPEPAARPQADLGTVEGLRRARDQALADVTRLRAERQERDRLNAEVARFEAEREAAFAREPGDAAGRAERMEQLREAVRRRDDARARRDELRDSGDIGRDRQAAESRLARYEALLDPRSRAPIPCFEPGTSVLVPDGSRPIADLAPGDEILTFDRATAAVVTSTVTAVHRNLTVHWYGVDLTGGTVRVTGRHRFLVPGAGWVEARRLEVGTPIRSSDGGTVEVTALSLQEVAEAESWNLTVAGTGCYFVGPGALVHNQGVDLGFDGPWVVYRGTNPLFPGLVYIGQTDRGAATRQGGHRGLATAQIAVLDAIALRRPLTPNEAAQRRFFEFMRGVELEVVVSGIPDPALADYLEQHNIDYERTFVGGEESLMNRREQITREIHRDEVLRRVRANPLLAPYCPV